MSQAMTYVSVPAAGTAAPSFSPGLRVLLAALVLSAAGGLLATTLVDQAGHPEEAPRLPPVPVASPAVTATGSTTVPDASAVFAGRLFEIEEPAPTF
jgi:hypothetical protein